MLRTQYLKTAAGNTVHSRVLGVYPREGVRDGELWLTAAAQHQERVLYCVLLAGKNSKFIIASTAFTECFCTVVKLKIVSSTCITCN